VTAVTEAEPCTRAAKRPRAPENHGVDDHLGPRPAEPLIADAERMGELVHKHAHLCVGRQAGVDDDPTALRVAPAAGATADRLQRDLEVDFARERLEALEQVAVRVAGQRLTRRLDRRGLHARQRVGLRVGEHERRTEHDPHLVPVPRRPHGA
jgi:hypothetical protein